MLSTYICLYFTKTQHGGVIKRRTEEAPKHAGEKRVGRTPGTMGKTRWGEEGSGPRRREYELTEDGIDLAEQWLEALRARRRLDELLVGLLERGLGEWSASGPGEDRDASGNKEPSGGSVDSGEDPSREERSK